MPNGSKKVKNLLVIFPVGEKPRSEAFCSILDKTGKEVFTQAEIDIAHIDFYADLYSESEIEYNAQTSLWEGIPQPVRTEACGSGQ